MPELTFEDLRCQYQNGRALLISGEGRNRVYGYRTGVQCKLGDIERSEWIRMVKDAIDRTGEQALYEQLLQHLKDHSYTRASRSELEFHALQLHAARIFDDELWVDYLQFNQRYRPEVIDPTRLVLVMPDCCKKAGQLTRTRFEENREYNCCPHCGSWTQIRLDYDTILACKRGDSDAFKRVLEHYDKMINQAATRTTRDESGKEVTFVDQEIKQNIQQTLMLQIYLKYDHLAGPPENDNSKKKGSC